MRKLLSTTLAVGILASVGFASSAYALDANVLPDLNNKSDNTSIGVSGNNMNIKIDGAHGDVGTLNWNSYNIGSDATVNYEFTANNQTALNKVAASGGLSQIYGKITNSGCAGCDYDGTGKIILINPNGVLFGDGANVNVNSFTASTFDASFDKDTNTLNLNRNGQTSDYGIVVMEGAQIYGDKAVNLVSDQVRMYNGSKISTNVNPNYVHDPSVSFGKVKIVTADGVNFKYYDNGAVEALGTADSTAKMTIDLNGEIISGNIDVRNKSTHTDSHISIADGAKLKATKAVAGNDGNIWLTSSNKIVISNATLQTDINSPEAAASAGGDIQIGAEKKVSVASSNLNANRDVIIVSRGDDAVVDSVTSNSKNFNLTAGKIAAIQNGSQINADNINVKGADVWTTNNAKLIANNAINIEATTGNYEADTTTLKSAKTVVKAKKDILAEIDAQDSITELYAENDINVKLANVGNKSKGLVAEAGKNVAIETAGTLSVSRLIAKDGDMTITANKVVAGTPYTTEEKIPGDNSERSYISVKNGTFTSNTANDSFEVTASDTLTPDGLYQQRHHIQYGNGSEKILLINNRPYTPVEQPNPGTPEVTVDDDQASMLNKIQRRPVTINNATNIADGRTTFVDVFAAASQIEIDEEDEE